MMRIERGDVGWIISLSFLGLAVVCRIAVLVLTLLGIN